MIGVKRVAVLDLDEEGPTTHKHIIRKGVIEIFRDPQQYRRVLLRSQPSAAAHWIGDLFRDRIPYAAAGGAGIAMVALVPEDADRLGHLIRFIQGLLPF